MMALDSNINKIAEALAARYDVIYYVDKESGAYTVYETNNIYGGLEISQEGMDFFMDAQTNSNLLVYQEDKARVQKVLRKGYLSSHIEVNKKFTTDYRLIVNGKPQHTRLTAMWATDRTHIVICVENVEAEVEKEQERVKLLRDANEMARRDALTGAKNKNAYEEFEKALQEEIDSGDEKLCFAIVICDLNDLKLVNDTMGHKSGDEYIQTGCKMIFDTFSHSPVFRVGGTNSS